jgi:hypothetical protein
MLGDGRTRRSGTVLEACGRFFTWWALWRLIVTNKVVNETPGLKLAPDARFIQITNRYQGLGLS